MNRVQDRGLITLMQVTRYFEVYSDGVKHFRNPLFLDTSLNKEAHAKIYVIETKPEYQCTVLFCKSWSQEYFLTGERAIHI